MFEGKMTQTLINVNLINYTSAFFTLYLMQVVCVTQGVGPRRCWHYCTQVGDDFRKLIKAKKKRGFPSVSYNKSTKYKKVNGPNEYQLLRKTSKK